jgi:hypothetical protein
MLSFSKARNQTLKLGRTPFAVDPRFSTAVISAKAMIQTPTVLVLGAGASQPYGYPLGQDLVNGIVKDAADSHSAMFQDLRNVPGADFVEETILSFGAALQASASLSIDAFLESRSDFTSIGRCAIASKLLRCEDQHIFHEKKDWYYYLFDKMRDSHRFESFGESKLSIVTFNYDRSLEFFLFRALKAGSQKTHAECVQIFNKIPIIHVHGRLGSQVTVQDGWPYGTPIAPLHRSAKFLERLADFANEIKIIHETTASTPEFLSARVQLRNAERICFLGFGYHPLNVQRLLDGIPGLDRKHFYCCGFGLSKKEMESIQRNQLNCGRTFEVGNADHPCLRFLREEAVLLD